MKSNGKKLILIVAKLGCLHKALSPTPAPLMMKSEVSTSTKLRMAPSCSLKG